MTPFFTRLTFAFKTFFSVLFRDRLPDDVAAALCHPQPAADSGRMQPDATSATVSAAPPPPAAQAEATATQLLAVLQRDGRLVDFLMEDIAPYTDAQVGAAVRTVHDGCRDALLRYLTLAPVLGGEEGGRVVVEAGTDAGRVKVIGNVSGPPPFSGTLRHRGWQVDRLALPPLASAATSVVAPAEVEIA